MKGRILYGRRVFVFRNLRELKIEVDGKPWIFDAIIQTQILFKPAALGGYLGTGNFLKQWRKREGLTQKQARRKLRMSQSLISLIENGDRSLPLRAFKKILKDNRLYEP